MKVIIMRGISGAGKSTWIQKNYPNAIIASADHFFVKADGSREFDASKLQDAHRACYKTYMQALLDKEPLIVVDNTNISTWEIAPYVRPAEFFDYEVELITLECDPEIAIQRKDWVVAQKTRANARLLKSETAKFPQYLKKIHQTINNC